MNTDHAISTHLDSVPHKLKTGKLVSVSNQVTPQLLGIEPRPKETKEERTQTSERDFPEKLADRRKIYTATVGTGRRRGRPPKIRVEQPEDEVEEEEHFEERVTDENDTATRKDNVIQLVGNDKIVILPIGDDGVEAGESDLDVPLEFCKRESEESLHETGVRRSGRTPKPTPKLKGAQKRKTAFIDGPRDFTPKEIVIEDLTQSEEIVTPVKRGRGRPPKKPKIDTEDTGNDAQNEQHISTESMESATKDEEQPPDEIPEGMIQEEDEIEEHEVVGAITKKLYHPIRRARRLLRLKGKRIAFKYRCHDSVVDCGFTTNKVREMANHRKLHKLEQNICYYCEQQFENREDVNEHLEKHKGPKPFYCPVCDTRFKTRTQLNLHLPKHSDDKPYICEVCSMGFKWKHALKNHMIVHSNKKDHLCDVCGYATAHKSQLKAHKLIHTGLTYKCNFPGCTFQATKRQNLKYHLLTHTREKPHQCEICGQNFSLVKNLRRHMLLHSTIKPHNCGQCEFATTRFDKLKEHLLKQHGFGSPPEKRVRITDLVRQHVLGQLIEPSKSGEHSTIVKIEQLMADSEEAAQAQEMLAIEGTLEDGTETVTTEAVINMTADTDGEPGTMELLPGQTIIITQPMDGGDMQTAEIAIPMAGQNSAIEGQQGDEFQTVGYTEVMIPVSQVAEYVQQVTYVTQ